MGEQSRQGSLALWRIVEKELSMPKPKASLTAALANKSRLQPAVAAEPPAAPEAKPTKGDGGSIATSLKIKRDMLAELKVLALRRRCRVNDVIVEAIDNHLAPNGRRPA
jgi:hypothetical protein